MMYSPSVEKAIQLACRLHKEQYRNDSERTPYVSHLFSVAMLLQRVTDDEDVIIAGLMHDSLEDVPGYTYERLVSDCGRRVADLVKSVSEPLDANKSQEEQLPWLTRKEAYLTNLRAGSNESVLISCADKIHNTYTYLEGVQQEGETYVARFTSSISNRVWFHEQVLSIALEKLGKENPLVEVLQQCTADFKELLVDSR